MNSTQKIQQGLIFSIAYHDYNKPLNLHAYFKLNDHSLGEDLVQNTFLKTWKYILKGGEIDVMKSFLYHILNNLIIDEYRKHKAVSLDNLIEKGFEPNYSANDFEHVSNFIDGKKALSLISSLPRIYQQVMRLRYQKYLSLKEISVITGQSKNTIAVQTYRGLEKLKALYKK